eukprot:6461657-Amphidinium_carterae.1
MLDSARHPMALDDTTARGPKKKHQSHTAKTKTRKCQSHKTSQEEQMKQKVNSSWRTKYDSGSLILNSWTHWHTVYSGCRLLPASTQVQQEAATLFRMFLEDVDRDSK